MLEVKVLLLLVFIKERFVRRGLEDGPESFRVVFLVKFSVERARYWVFRVFLNDVCKVSPRETIL